MIQAERFTARGLWPALVALTLLSGCDTAPATPPEEPPEPGVLEATRSGPADAPPGSCWGKTVSPAVVERVTQRVEIKPAKINPDGTISELPVYRNEDRQVIVTPRRDNWFETPCPDVLTVEFVSSLQRALIARGDYAGSVTGVLDPSTRKAIRRYQAATGPDSGVLSLESARMLGLVSIERPAAE